MTLNLTGTNEDVEATDALAREGNDEDQMSRGSLAMAFYGVSSAFFFVYIGAAMALAYGTADALIGIALSVIAYGVINAILSRYAINNRTTVAAFSRTILGKAGSAIAMVIFALIAIYYAVFEGSLVAYAFMEAFGGEMWLWSLVVVAGTTPLIIGGVRRFLDKINGILLPIYFFGLVAAVVWAGVKYGFTTEWLSYVPETPLPFAAGGPGWLATFAGYMGVWILMMYTMDFAALGKRKDTKFHQIFTFGPFFYVAAFAFSAIVGIMLTFMIPGTEASETGLVGGVVNLMGGLGILVVIATQTRINTANYYLGAANLRSFGEKALRIRMPNIVWVLLAAVIIYLLMLLPVVQYILVALAWQGVLVTAWVAIALTHILMSRGKGQEHAAIDDRNYKQVNANGLTAWIIATLVGVVMLQLGAMNPDLAGVGSTWGPIFTAVAASLVYGLLWRTNPTSRTGLIPVVGA